MASDHDLHALLTRAAAGEGGAVDDLLAVLHPLARRYCRTRLRPLGGSHQVADQVAQDVCIAVLLDLRHYPDTDVPAEAMVYRLAADKVAAVDQPARTEDDEDIADPGRDMLATLPDQLREVLVLRAAVGMDVDEVARALQQTAGAVRFNQHRAVRRLRPVEPGVRPLDLAQIRAVDVLLDALLADELELPEQSGEPDAGSGATPDRDAAWLAAMAALRTELDEHPDLTERLHRVLAGRPLWALDPSEHPTPPELEDTAPLDLLVVPALPPRRESRLAGWAEQYVPVVSAAAVAVLLVGGFSSLISREPLAPVEGVARVVVGLTQPDAPETTAGQGVDAAARDLSALERQVKATIVQADAAAKQRDWREAQQLLRQASTKVQRIEPAKAKPLQDEIAKVQAKVDPETSPTSSPSTTTKPSPSATGSPTTTTSSSSSSSPATTTAPATTTPSTAPDTP